MGKHSSMRVFFCKTSVIALLQSLDMLWLEWLRSPASLNSTFLSVCIVKKHNDKNLRGWKGEEYLLQSQKISAQIRKMSSKANEKQSNHRRALGGVRDEDDRPAAPVLETRTHKKTNNNHTWIENDKYAYALIARINQDKWHLWWREYFPKYTYAFFSNGEKSLILDLKKPSYCLGKKNTYTQLFFHLRVNQHMN